MKLFTMGDSISQGFMSLAVARYSIPIIPIVLLFTAAGLDRLWNGDAEQDSIEAVEFRMLTMDEA